MKKIKIFTRWESITSARCLCKAQKIWAITQQPGDILMNNGKLAPVYRITHIPSSRKIDFFTTDIILAKRYFRCFLGALHRRNLRSFDAMNPSDRALKIYEDALNEANDLIDF